MSKNVLALLSFVVIIGWTPHLQSKTIVDQNFEDSEKVMISFCSNFGDNVSGSFISCLNRNFQNIGRELWPRVIVSSCFNEGEGVSFSFESCINRNFFNIEREFERTSLPRCSNYIRDRVNVSFIRCINSNFSRIASEI